MTLTIRKAENRKITPHFSESEFKCKCCGKILYFPDLILLLEKLRYRLGRKPIIIHSGYRCPSHNAKVGGATESLHMLGMAADISVFGESVDEIADMAKEIGFGGIGRYYTDKFVHVDVRGDNTYWIEK